VDFSELALAERGGSGSGVWEQGGGGGGFHAGVGAGRVGLPRGRAARGSAAVGAARGRLATAQRAGRRGGGRRCWEQRRRGTKNRIEVKVNCTACGKREVACWYNFFKNVSYPGTFIG
jgi:hypothetical protein